MVTEFRISVTFVGGREHGEGLQEASGADGNVLLLDLVGGYKGEFSLWKLIKL